MLWLTADLFPVFVPLGLIGLYRYIWFIIKLVAYSVYQPRQPKANPTYHSRRDVTLIVPTIDAGEEFIEAANSWLANDPKEILIITETSMVGPLEELAARVCPEKIRVLSVPKANKRLQMVEGVKHTTTEILVFVDDDAIWPPRCLEYILACYEDPCMGGVGTSQTVKSIGEKQTVWEVLAGFRLTIRNIEIAASTHIDGGVCCLSGRTAAYRSCILKDPEFQHAFTNDYWMGKYPLNSGDDKFLTRWMVSHGWNTYIQVCKEAELLSTFKTNWHFLKQVLRWTRNTWRSDFRSLFTERHIWRRHPYVAFTMMDKLFNPFTLLSGPVSVLYLCIRGNYHLPLWNVWLSYTIWLMGTRVIKLTPHLWKRPQDVLHVPAFVLFNYYFAVMKLYALCTLHVTAWGTRQGVDDEEVVSTDPVPVSAKATEVSVTRTNSDLHRPGQPMLDSAISGECDPFGFKMGGKCTTEEKAGPIQIIVPPPPVLVQSGVITGVEKSGGQAGEYGIEEPSPAGPPSPARPNNILVV